MCRNEEHYSKPQGNLGKKTFNGSTAYQWFTEPISCIYNYNT